jgi:hypothetical protein
LLGLGLSSPGVKYIVILFRCRSGCILVILVAACRLVLLSLDRVRGRIAFIRVSHASL